MAPTPAPATAPAPATSSLSATLGWTLALLAGGGVALGATRRRREASHRRLRCVESQRLDPGCRVHLLCCEGRWLLVATTRERAVVLDRWREAPRPSIPFPRIISGHPHATSQAAGDVQ